MGDDSGFFFGVVVGICSAALGITLYVLMPGSKYVTKADIQNKVPIKIEGVYAQYSAVRIIKHEK